MIFSKEVAVQQVANLLHRYNGLYVNSMSEEKNFPDGFYYG